MIRRLHLRNWRAYRDAEVDLNRPLVFLVAPNGVGKTSFYEAARRCVLGFSTGKDAGRAVREDAERAEISVDMEVGDNQVGVTRTITRSGRRTFTATCDGRSLDESSFFELLSNAWAAGPSLVDRLAFGDIDPRGRTRQTLPIREHLAHLMGITPMVETAALLRGANASARKAVAGQREDVAGSQEAIGDAENELNAAERTLDHVVSRHSELSEQIERAQLQASMARDWEAFRDAVETYNTQVAAIVADIGHQFSIDSSDPLTGLESTRQAATADLRSAQDTRIEAERLAARTAAAHDVLSQPVDHCPTCLRSLSDEERTRALREHGATSARANSDSENAMATIEQEERRVELVEGYIRRLDRLTPPSAPSHEDPGASASDRLMELRSRDRDLSEQLGAARERRDAVRESLQLERSNLDDLSRLNRLAREELLLETTAEIFEKVADRCLTERIEPLARDVAYRWKLLMGQEGLVLDPTGEIRLRRGSLDLDSVDMSGGERAVAGVVVRLLVAASATRIPTCWYDEPLEHLDPRRRAGVAQTLVGAAAAGTISQIVVTTYEERMVRQLALAAPDLVTVLYADTDPAGRAHS